MCRIRAIFLVAGIVIAASGCKAIEIVHSADFISHAERSVPVTWLAATLGANNAIALLLVIAITLASVAYRLWRSSHAKRQPLVSRRVRQTIVEEETHRIRITRQVEDDDSGG
jgi:hypothetical protein